MTVYFVRKSGSDLNDGLSPSHAFLTIGKAMTKISGSAGSGGGGDIVYIGGGKYGEVISPSTGFYGNSGSLQRIIADTTGIYTGDGGEVSINGIRDDGNGAFYSYEYLNVSGAFDDIYGSKDELSLYVNPNGFVFKPRYHFIGCRFATTVSINDGGIIGSEYRFFDCTFGENIRHLNPLITAACWTGHGDLIQFCNCTFRSSLKGYNALHSYDANKLDIRNCIFINAVSGSTAAVIDFRFTAAQYAKFTSDYNLFDFSQTAFILLTLAGVPLSFVNLAAWQAGTIFDDHSLTGNAGFVSASFGVPMDFHLQAHSPAIGVAFSLGVSSSLDYPNLYTADWEKDPRTILWDIGADQINFPIVTLSGTILSNAHIIARSTYQINSAAYVLAHSTADPTNFSFPITIESQVALPAVNSTAFDLSLKHVCNHVLASGTFRLTTCPRCLGTGYYYDIKLTPDGLFETTSKIAKLQQELEKIVLTEGNPFHPDYGANLQARVGDISIQRLKPIIESDLRKAVGQLQMLQEQAVGVNIFSSDELISHIDSIIIQESGQTGLQFSVNIITRSAQQITLQGFIDLV